MEIGKPHNEAWARVANGIEAGTVGGLAMLALLLSGSLWDGHVWWEVPNLFGSTFYGPRAFRSGPGMSTLAGVALHFVITGTLGALFGLAFGGIEKRGRLIILGLLSAVGWYNLANMAFWPTVNPWVLVASPRPAIMVSHVLLGACLGYMGQRQRLPPPTSTLLESPGPLCEALELEPQSEPFLIADSAPETLVEPPQEHAPEPGLEGPVEPAPPHHPEPPPAPNSISALE